MPEPLTGYEATSVADVEAFLDGNPAASSDEVYLGTVGHSERAIAAVAAKRAGAGGGGSMPARGAYAYLTETVDEFHRGIIPFDAVDFDTDGFFDPVTHLVTAPVGLAGLYLAVLSVDAFGVDASLPIGVAAIGTSAATGGSSLDMPRSASDTSWVGTVSLLLRLAEGESLNSRVVWTTADDGLFVTLFGGLGGPNFFSVAYLGPLP